jgi:hypothetical protein
VAAVAVLAGGCGRTPTPAAQPTSPSPAASPAPASSPLGNGPSVSARMICADEAQGDIAAALGVRPPKPPVSTWADHLFTCRYTYPSGVLTLSVKELPDAAATAAYYDGMRQKYAGGGAVPGLGEAAYVAPNGSALVRKDFKVLWVDITGLPAQFGQPALSRGDVAFRVASVIMGCWTGA